jgi:hypothetical protein
MSMIIKPKQYYFNAMMKLCNANPKITFATLSSVFFCCAKIRMLVRECIRLSKSLAIKSNAKFHLNLNLSAYLILYLT